MTSKLYRTEKEAEFKWNQHSRTIKTRDPVHVAPAALQNIRPAMNPEVCLLRLRQGDHSLEEFCGLSALLQRADIRTGVKRLNSSYPHALLLRADIRTGVKRLNSSHPQCSPPAGRHQDRSEETELLAPSVLSSCGPTSGQE
ncbi:unnamed protein product [Leuciscus chuanchicus]